MAAKKKAKKKATKRKRVKKKKVVKRRKAKKLPEKAEVYYMGIPNPVEIRKNILESARDMVQFLQMFEKFRIIREEKKQASALLKKHVRELTTLTNKIKTMLPKTSLRTKSKKIEPEKIEKVETIEALKEAPQKSELPDIDVDDIEELETELRDIEDKLNFL